MTEKRVSQRVNALHSIRVSSQKVLNTASSLIPQYILLFHDPILCAKHGTNSKFYLYNTPLKKHIVLRQKTHRKILLHIVNLVDGQPICFTFFLWRPVQKWWPTCTANDHTKWSYCFTCRCLFDGVKLLYEVLGIQVVERIEIDRSAWFRQNLYFYQMRLLLPIIFFYTKHHYSTNCSYYLHTKPFGKKIFPFNRHHER